MPRPQRPCQVSGFGEAGLTYRVITSITPRIVREDSLAAWRQLLAALCQVLYPLKRLTITLVCYSSHPTRLPMAPARGFSSRLHRRHHLDSAAPIRSVHSCSPPPLPSGSTRDARATPVSIGCDCPFAASPNAASPGPRGSTASANSYPPAY